jgi:WD40 repeat protein
MGSLERTMVLIHRICALAATVAIASQALTQAPSILWRAKTRSPINAIAFSRGGEYIVTAGADGYVKSWRISDGRPLRTITRHYDGAVSLAFSHDGTLLASGGNDDSIHMVRTSDWKAKYTISETGFILGLAFAPDDQTFGAALGYFSRELREFQTSSGELWSIVHHHWGSVWSVDYSPDGQHAVTSGADGRVLLYDRPIWNPTDLTPHQDDAISAKFSPSGSIIASAGEYEGIIRLHDVASTGLLRAIDVGWTLLSIGFSPDGSFIAASGHALPDGGRISFYRVSDGGRLQTYTSDTAGSVNAIAISPSGMTFAYGRNDGVLVLARMPAFKGQL